MYKIILIINFIDTRTGQIFQGRKHVASSSKMSSLIRTIKIVSSATVYLEDEWYNSVILSQQIGTELDLSIPQLEWKLSVSDLLGISKHRLNQMDLEILDLDVEYVLGG